MKSRIQLSDHFTYGRLYRFVLPPIVMMIFTSVYTVVDGFFVSNFAGKTAFASLNIIFPFLMLLGAFGFMLGAGGSALVAKTLGEGDRQKANGIFSLLVYTVVVLGLIFALLGVAFMRPIARLLGAEDGELLDGCVVYGRIMTAAIPLYMLQNMFQTFFVTAEKPKTGLIVILIAGVTNAVGDALLVGIFKLGLAGAALASAIGQAVGGVIPIVYFARRNTGLLRLGRARPDIKALLFSCANGSSELLSNISASVVAILYNYRLLAIAGEDGVDAYGIIMYANFLFAAVFFGFSMGSAPIFGYNFGAQNRGELKSLFKKSAITVTVCGAAMTVLSLALSVPLSRLFAGYDDSLAEMTARGMMIYSLSFLFVGLNIFASALFTALNNGGLSALISFLRTFVFQVLFILLLPLIISPPIDGVWCAVIAAEGVSFMVSAAIVLHYRKRYGYM